MLVHIRERHAHGPCARIGINVLLRCGRGVDLLFVHNSHHEPVAYRRARNAAQIIEPVIRHDRTAVFASLMICPNV
jgi:hypothetical protein